MQLMTEVQLLSELCSLHDASSLQAFVGEARSTDRVSGAELARLIQQRHSVREFGAQAPTAGLIAACVSGAARYLAIAAIEPSAIVVLERASGHFWRAEGDSLQSMCQGGCRHDSARLATYTHLAYAPWLAWACARTNSVGVTYNDHLLQAGATSLALAYAAVDAGIASCFGAGVPSATRDVVASHASQLRPLICVSLGSMSDDPVPVAGRGEHSGAQSINSTEA